MKVAGKCGDEETRCLSTFFTDQMVESLRSGDRLFLNGKLYTARDAAHKRLVELIDEGAPLPVSLEGQIIFFVGPTPARPGRSIGSAGPTTSGRMDAYSPKLLDLGLKGMIGKGARSEAVRDSLRRNKAVYMAATGGAGALLAECITAARVVAYEDLGAEAIRELQVKNFPVIVINDIYGGDFYEKGRRQFEQKVES